MTQQEAWKVIRGIVYDHDEDLVATISFMRDNLEAFSSDTKIAFHVLYGALKKAVR